MCIYIVGSMRSQHSSRDGYYNQSYCYMPWSEVHYIILPSLLLQNISPLHRCKTWSQNPQCFKLLMHVKGPKQIEYFQRFFCQNASVCLRFEIEQNDSNLWAKWLNWFIHHWIPNYLTKYFVVGHITSKTLGVSKYCRYVPSFQFYSAA